MAEIKLFLDRRDIQKRYQGIIDRLCSVLKDHWSTDKHRRGVIDEIRFEIFNKKARNQIRKFGEGCFELGLFHKKIKAP